MLAGVAEWQTRTFKGRVGDRVGSSPTTSTKKTFGSFFVGGTLCFAQQTLCVWNPHCVAGARLCLPVSGVKLTLDCTSHQPHQKDLRVFFCWWDFCTLCNKCFAFGTHTVWLAPVSPCPSAESS